MLKRILVASGVLVVLLVLGVFVWARTVLTGDAVRTAMAAQLTKALGHPVTIGRLGASIFPRLAMDLHDVRIGEPARVSVQTLEVGTSLGALLSRRIAHATVRLNGARLELPLPSFRFGGPGASATSPSSSPAGASASGITLVSVDQVLMNDVSVTSGGRTMQCEVDLALAGQAVDVRKIVLRAEGTNATVTGRITDLNGPTGDLNVQAGALSFLDLLSFVSDFSRGMSGGASGAAPAPRSSSTMNLVVSLEAERATLATLTLDTPRGKARVTSDAVTLDPIQFGVLGGGYDGTLALSLGQTPAFRLSAKLSGVDMTQAMAFAGSPGTLTGRLTGTIEIAGRGTTADEVIRTAQGTARIAVTNGSVKGLGLVRGVILATSGRQASRAQLGSAATDEPFTRLSATLNIGDGMASTRDLQFESSNLRLSAVGALRLDGRAVDLAGPLQLSDALSRQAGRDLARYTQKDGRVTIPVTVSGPAQNLQVGVDVGDLAKRALSNAAADALKKALLKKLGRGGGG